MKAPEGEVFDRRAQRVTEQQWLAAVERREEPRAVRDIVRASWERCLGARVACELEKAPVALDEAALDDVRERVDWLPIALQAVGRGDGAFSGGGHILSVFDAEGRMLSSQGDPRALEGLSEINFRPGGLWSEAAAGTNGPGTALATGGPAHIVGAEHFCQAWHRWHCAAVPIRDQTTGRLLGAVDISGFRENAHPHTLNLAAALVVAIEQTLAARDTERRYLTLERFTELTTRYPGEAALAVDRGGRILCMTTQVPRELRAGGNGPPPLGSVVSSLLDGVRDDGSRAITLPLPDNGQRTGVWYPVFHEQTAVGGCIVLDGGRPRPNGRRTPSRPSGAETRYSFADLLGEHPHFAAARRVAEAAASNSLPVLLSGESGTGKEIVAQAIHNASARRGRPFIAVNCAALPAELIESELFGYAPGAFTGSRREGGTGKFEAADGGTIFLDEITELSPAAQASLLRVLQEGEITPVGSATSRPLDARVIAATNRDIAGDLDSGRLRADVYYRLNVLAVELPPLRARQSDVPLLAAHFAVEAVRELRRPACALDAEVIEAFRRYTWPGNVRELKNTVSRLVALTWGSRVGLADLPSAIRNAAGHRAAAGPRSVSGDPSPTTAGTSMGAARTAASGRLLDSERLMEVVASARTLAEAAAQLGITRSTLYRQMRRCGLRPKRVFGQVN